MADSSRPRNSNNKFASHPSAGSRAPFHPGTSNRTKSVAEILQTALKVHGIGKQASRYAGFHLWPEIVGDDIAAVAEPLKIMRGNILQVRVVDAVWAQELALRKHEIVGKLSGGVLGSVIEDLQFVVHGPKPQKR